MTEAEQQAMQHQLIGIRLNLDGLREQVNAALRLLVTIPEPAPKPEQPEYFGDEEELPPPGE